MKTKTKNKTRASGMVQQVEIFANEYKNESPGPKEQERAESLLVVCRPSFTSSGMPSPPNQYNDNLKN